MRRYNTECIVLKKINIGDADKIFTLLSKDKGKISAMAKGVRKISSRRSGSLDSLNRISVSISEDHKSFKTINEVKIIESFSDVKNSLDLSKHAYYVLEVLNKFLDEGHENDDIYNLASSTLNGLNNKELSPVLIISRFEILLLKYMGYELSLDSCVNCRRKYDEDWSEVGFSFELGGLFCDRCNLIGQTLRKSDSDMLNKLSKNRYNKSFEEFDLNNVSSLTRKFLMSVLGHKLKSLEI